MNMKLHGNIVKVFVDQLDTIESTKPQDANTVLASAASLLIDVKTSQRELFNLLDKAILTREEKAIDLERQKLLLQNLLYEKSQLQAQLCDCREYPTPHLERMSRDELNHDTETPAKTMNVFLCGSTEISIHDPTNNKRVMEKLHKELNARGALQRDQEKAQTSLNKRRRVAEQEKGFLNDIPKKLEMVERSSVPLQKFFQSASTTEPLRLIGSDRKRRLDLARTLPGPLYSLFVQFQAHLDGQANNSVSLEIARHSKGQKSDEVAPNPQVVHLSFVIPDIHLKEGSSTKRKRVTVEFAFVEAYSVVTATAVGFPEKVNAAVLLDNLFPGDLGTWISQPDDSTSLPGKPYHWCNFLAGLHFPPPQPSNDRVHRSTKAVIRELSKRVKANATLTQILATFDKNKPVAHPSFTNKLSVSDCTAKLTSWTTVEGEITQKPVVIYAATIKNAASTLSARVSVNWHLYPSVPPSWSLCEGEEAWATKHGSVSRLHDETNPLYSHLIGQIESQINGNFESLADTNDASSYDWIIAHQLIKIIGLWDEAQNEREGAEGSFRGNTRSRKGRTK
mmetsp:Transcript_5495/g.9069  ORF Transcript_5495/g.9069 Transcript_5495/m.9069 type:complete len:565 (+) Transcript_5495:255-1949(+)